MSLTIKQDYLEYHHNSVEIGDVDPAYPMIDYLCSRFELNTEQRYWLAFLYACTYSGPSAYAIYNRFPDFETVNEGAVGRWWKQMKLRLLFQSDRRWVKSNDLFPVIVSAYRSLIGGGSQEAFFAGRLRDTPSQSYISIYKTLGTLPQFGRFALFLYTEALKVICGLPIEPPYLDLRDAESSRNGVAFAINRSDLLTGKAGNGRKTVKASDVKLLQSAFAQILALLRSRYPLVRSDVWNVETTLCAYHKYKKGQRYIGYYLDRQYKEIKKMESVMKEGVCWQPLWDYRIENLDHKYLQEARP